MHRDAFGTYHPALVFGFFIAAIVLCVIVNDPRFLVCGILCAAVYYLCVHGRKGLKVIAGMLPLFIIVASVNPLLSANGQTVLFTWLDNRPYTLEALAFGACTACMLVAALLWFFSYNKVMTSEKFTYLFGGMAPALTLVFTMVLRLVPTYQRKAKEISTSRASVGRAAFEGSLKARAVDGLAVLSALVTWAIEGAIITADSMRSRGYGVGKRSSFARYPFTLRDFVLAAVMIACFAASIACIVLGAGTVRFYPVIDFGPFTPQDALGLAAYSVFLLIPTCIDLWEALSWRISLSRV